MFSKTSGMLALQAAALISGAAARCVRTCPADEPLLNLLRSVDESTSFCRTFLGLPALNTDDVTFAPTVVPTANKISNGATESATDIGDKVDANVDAKVDTKVDAKVDANVLGTERDLVYPAWLPSTYGTKYVSKACSCLILGPSPAVPAVRAPVDATDSETAKSQAVTAPISRSVRIEVVRKATGSVLGYLSNNGGLAVTVNSDLAAVFQFTMSEGLAIASKLRLTSPFGALGFSIDSSLSSIEALVESFGSLNFVTPAAPDSISQTTGSVAGLFASDIWIVDTASKEITWQWIAKSGALANIQLWYSAGRLYSVGSLDKFLSAIGLTDKFEVTLRYTLV
ncbi:hypothetical protein QBC42DRAFT_199553 [Cladorrhinum samala]|uniref:Uncharacterized protein n=1 Tax=Cladorrhinum samala TaxID=585594 RepID=A0AAV9HVW4_9PEZI|nr:hypothetical protein QBC42DRAFT_199553 [Cladorrhinum samala]